MKTNTSTRTRINIILPRQTIELIDRVAPPGNRSRLIDQAVRYFIDTKSRQSLRKQLKEGAIQNATRDIRLARDWHPIEYGN